MLHWGYPVFTLGGMGPDPDCVRVRHDRGDSRYHAPATGALDQRAVSSPLAGPRGEVRFPKPFPGGRRPVVPSSRAPRTTKSTSRLRVLLTISRAGSPSATDSSTGSRGSSSIASASARCFRRSSSSCWLGNDVTVRRRPETADVGSPCARLTWVSRTSSKIDRKRRAAREPSEPSTATRMRLTCRGRPRTIATGQGVYRATASGVLPTKNRLTGQTAPRILRAAHRPAR